LKSFVKAVNEVVLEGLDLEMAQILCETLLEMTDALVVKKQKGVDITEFVAPYIYDFLVMTLRCMGCFHTFKLSNKEEPEEIIENKKNVQNMLKNLSALSTEENYFES
jgi:hypothetical protein